MNVNVHRIPDKPIVIVTYDKLTHFQAQIREVHQQVAEIMNGIEGPCYRIDNYRSLNVTSSLLVSALFEESQWKPGSATDPRIRHIVVGAARVLRIGALTPPRRFTSDKRTPVFLTVNEAIIFAQAEAYKQEPSISVS